MLKTQGLQMNRSATIVSTGGETVRNLQADLSPQAEPVLDWFHIAGRITAMQQMAKGLPSEKNFPGDMAELIRLKY